MHEKKQRYSSGCLVHRVCLLRWSVGRCQNGVVGGRHMEMGSDGWKVRSPPPLPLQHGRIDIHGLSAEHQEHFFSFCHFASSHLLISILNCQKRFQRWWHYDVCRPLKSWKRNEQVRLLAKFRVKDAARSIRKLNCHSSKQKICEQEERKWKSVSKGFYFWHQQQRQKWVQAKK